MRGSQFSPHHLIPRCMVQCPESEEIYHLMFDPLVNIVKNESPIVIDCENSTKLNVHIDKVCIL